MSRVVALGSEGRPCAHVADDPSSIRGQLVLRSAHDLPVPDLAWEDALDVQALLERVEEPVPVSRERQDQWKGVRMGAGAAIGYSPEPIVSSPRPPEMSRGATV